MPKHLTFLLFFCLSYIGCNAQRFISAYKIDSIQAKKGLQCYESVLTPDSLLGILDTAYLEVLGKRGGAVTNKHLREFFNSNCPQALLNVDRIWLCGFYLAEDTVQEMGTYILIFYIEKLNCSLPNGFKKPIIVWPAPMKFELLAYEKFSLIIATQEPKKSRKVKERLRGKLR